MRILLVEDDDMVAKALIQKLTEQHYTVDIAADGQAGWELVDALTGRPDFARSNAAQTGWAQSLSKVAIAGNKHPYSPVDCPEHHPD